MTRGLEPARTARILQLYRPVADEVVVAVDERSEDAVPILAAVADRVLTFPFAEPGDRAIPWLFESCRQPWILNVDDDEIPSRALLERLPEVLSDDVTHCWIGRRWLYPGVATYLAEPPWVREYQLRLVAADRRFVQFSDEFHRPVVCHGPARFVSEPLWHLDTALNPFEARRRKAIEYERAWRGMRIASVSHNTGLYLPELRPGAATAPVAPEELASIRAVLDESGEVPTRPGARAERAERADVDRHWPGPPWPPALYDARLELAERPRFLVAGVQQTIDVRLENRGDRTWPWGPEGRPAIRLAYRWQPEAVEPLRTTLPCDLRGGETLVVPVHVLPPPDPGRYVLELDLLHEGVRWFGCGLRLPVEVRARRRVAVAVGDRGKLAETLDALAEQPELEPVLLWPGRPTGETEHPQLAGLRELLVGTDAPLGRARILWRTARVLASPARFLPGLARCEQLIVSGADWERGAPQSRELWRLATTVAAARRLGVDVVVADEAAWPARGPVDRLLRVLMARLGRAGAAQSSSSSIRPRPSPGSKST